MNIDSMRNHRQRIVIIAMTALFLAIMLKLFYFSVIRHKYLSGRAVAEVTRHLNLEPVRGKIIARDGTVLAKSIISVSIALDTFKIRLSRHDVKIAQRLSETLKVPVEELLSKIHSRYSAVWAKKNIDRTTFRHLMKLKYKGLLPGVTIKRTLKRVYPRHPLAASVIGFALGHLETGAEALGPYRNIRGIEGLESYYNDELTGIEGRYSYYANRFGEPEADSLHAIVPLRPGNDIRISLDPDLQGILHDELYKVLVQREAESALGIILKPETGEILASDSVEAIPEEIFEGYCVENPMNRWPQQARRSLSNTEVFEPGSIWKPVIMSIAMENGLVSPGDILPWKPSLLMGTHRFKDWKTFDSTIRLDEVLTYSSNVGIIQVSKKIFAAMKPAQIASWFKKLGFFRPLPVDFSVRPRGLLRPSAWGPISVGAIAEGYELSISMAQLGGFYCAIANGGFRVSPHYGLEIISAETGKLIRNLRGTPERKRILSQRTVSFITQAMTACVDHGTGRKGSLAALGCIAAGKTATAKLSVNHSYNSGKYRASFAGFFPVEKPEYVIIISVKAPSKGSYYGGSVAGPVFKAVGTRILELHGCREDSI